MVEETPTWFVFNEICVCHKKKTIDNANIILWNLLNWEVVVFELGSGQWERANVVHCGQNWPPIDSCDTKQNIVCQNSRNDACCCSVCICICICCDMLLLSCACCIIFQIVFAAEVVRVQTEPNPQGLPAPSRVNSCKSCHKNSLQFQKGPSYGPSPT